MKKTIFCIFTLFLTGSIASAGIPTQKVIPVTHVFVPSGFDSNDNSEIILTGFLPNLCHKTPKANAMVTGNKIDILLTSLYYDESNPFCPEMVVPFTETLELGVLDKGKYEITVNGKSTYSILPKMKQVRSHCPMKLVPFEYEWKVPNDIDRNEVLLHVRTLEGRSRNTLFYR